MATISFYKIIALFLGWPITYIIDKRLGIEFKQYNFLTWLTHCLAYMVWGAALVLL